MAACGAAADCAGCLSGPGWSTCAVAGPGKGAGTFCALAACAPCPAERQPSLLSLAGLPTHSPHMKRRGADEVCAARMIPQQKRNTKHCLCAGRPLAFRDTQCCDQALKCPAPGVSADFTFYIARWEARSCNHPRKEQRKRCESVCGHVQAGGRRMPPKVKTIGREETQGINRWLPRKGIST